jgi:Cu(I)/Ag(I) efflux system membrane protein CusA/SilA
MEVAVGGYERVQLVRNIFDRFRPTYSETGNWRLVRAKESDWKRLRELNTSTIWSLHLLGYPTSPSVWVGLIALLGVDAETGTFMLLHLDLVYERMLAEGRLRTRADLREAIMTGAVSRAWPKFMTVATMFIGLAPILWSTGAGAEVMKRIAAPMVGGLATSFLMELMVYPMLYEWWKA